jgi:hypothetical protein
MNGFKLDLNDQILFLDINWRGSTVVVSSSLFEKNGFGFFPKLGPYLELRIPPRYQ